MTIENHQITTIGDAGGVTAGERLDVSIGENCESHGEPFRTDIEGPIDCKIGGDAPRGAARAEVMTVAARSHCSTVTAMILRVWWGNPSMLRR
jgi:hypothetical protein